MTNDYDGDIPDYGDDSPPLIERDVASWKSVEAGQNELRFSTARSLP